MRERARVMGDERRIKGAGDHRGIEKRNGDEDEGGSGAKSLEGEQTVTDAPIHCTQNTTMKT